MKTLQCYPSFPPKVSVLTATYNRENLLPTCIESVMAQTFKNWEHIIIDDGSHDETLNLVRKYMASDPRIRYAAHSNRGQSLSLNVGLMMAAGEYVCILDSDDYYLPDHLASRLQYLKANPEVDFLHGGAVVVGDEYVADANIPHRKIHLNECCVHGSFFGKTAAFKSVGGYKNIVFGNDKDILDRIREKGFCVRKLEAAEYKTMVYSRTEDSITKQFEKRRREEWAKSPIRAAGQSPAISRQGFLRDVYETSKVS
jgi:glycosyltransferase involved in cell wall biosynthesis